MYMIIKGDNMKKNHKLKIDKTIIILLGLFIIISIFSIMSASKLLPSYMNNLYIKQILWYIFGIILIIFILFIGNDFIFSKANILYIFGNILLILVLFLGTTVNDARCWFSIPGIGTLQPSELMKIILIIKLGTMIKKFNDTYSNPSIKNEFYFLLKVIIIVLIPSIITFVEPDTGVVLIYLIITITMLFISGIRYRWFVLLFSIISILIISILLIYFYNKELFVNILGSSFFLRVERLLNWSNRSGYQLENGLISIGSSGLMGNGLFNTPIYFPEPQTDFIFAVYGSNFGFIGSFILIVLFIIFCIKIINISKKTSNINKYIISGFIGMFTYQIFQNIGMTIGLMPITGITLPFISYGGSSLISYIMMVGIILNISKEK